MIPAQVLVAFETTIGSRHRSRIRDALSSTENKPQLIANALFCSLWASIMGKILDLTDLTSFKNNIIHKKG